MICKICGLTLNYDSYACYEYDLCENCFEATGVDSIYFAYERKIDDLICSLQHDRDILIKEVIDEAIEK